MFVVVQCAFTCCTIDVTGVAVDQEQAKQWIKAAKKNGALGHKVAHTSIDAQMCVK